MKKHTLFLLYSANVIKSQVCVFWKTPDPEFICCRRINVFAYLAVWMNYCSWYLLQKGLLIKFTKYTRMHLQPTQIFFPRKTLTQLPPPPLVGSRIPPPKPNYACILWQTNCRAGHSLISICYLLLKWQPCLVGCYHNPWDTLLHLKLNSIILFNKNISKLIT